MNKDYVINLISLPLTKITFDTKYKWKKFKNIIVELQNNIMNSSNITEFTNNYIIYLIIFNNYVNYLDFIHCDDINSDDIGTTIINFKYNEKIFSKLMDYKNNNNNIINNNNNISNNNISNIVIKDIIDIINPFLYNRMNTINNITNNIKHIENIKTYDKILNYENSYKKLSTLIMYRYLFCKNDDLKITNYNDFYSKYYIENYKFDKFKSIITQIPKIQNIFNKNILSINDLYFAKNKIEYRDIDFDLLMHVINYFNTHKQYNLKLSIHSNTFIITSGTNKIHVIKSSDNDILFIQNNLQNFAANTNHQDNLLNYLKNTNNMLCVKYIEIVNFVQMLCFIHNIVTSIELINSKCTSVSNFCSSNYIKYFYHTYYLYILFLFEYDVSIQHKCIKFLFEHLYIFAHYDYYFYYDTNLINVMIKHPDKKCNILIDFCSHVEKNIYRLPNINYNYPPFYANINDDENEIYGYTYGVPSYFKFYYFILALIDIYKFEFIDINKIYYRIMNSNDNINTNTNNNNVHNQTQQTQQTHQTINVSNNNKPNNNKPKNNELKNNILQNNNVHNNNIHNNDQNKNKNNEKIKYIETYCNANENCIFYSDVRPNKKK